MALEVTYKGTQIAQLTTNGNLTLETAGKYCEGNIGIAYTGGQGFDANSAILKVITSTNCTILVTGTNYSETHQQADGFPRSSDANVTEHFFSIPTTAFGTITVTSTNTYGNNTKTITINTAGKIYELYCGGINIILNNTFGLKAGMQLYNENYASYDDKNKKINIIAAGSWLFGNPVSGGTVIPIDVYTQIKCTAKADANMNTGYLYLRDTDNENLSTITFTTTSATKTANITNKYYDSAGIYYQYISEITEIILM